MVNNVQIYTSIYRVGVLHVVIYIETVSANDILQTLCKAGLGGLTQLRYMRGFDETITKVIVLVMPSETTASGVIAVTVEWDESTAKFVFSSRQACDKAECEALVRAACLHQLRMLQRVLKQEHPPTISSSEVIVPLSSTVLASFDGGVGVQLPSHTSLVVKVQKGGKALFYKRHAAYSDAEACRACTALR